MGLADRNNKSMTETEHQDPYSVKNCIEKADKKIASEVKPALENESCSKFNLEAEVIDDIGDAAIKNIDKYDLSSDNKSINSENSSVDQMSSDITGSFDKTYQMEIHLSAPRNQKLVVLEQACDTS